MATRVSTIDRIINPKHEIRNSKQSQMAKFRIFETNKRLRHLDFENSNLFRLPAGRQGFRYSDFGFLKHQTLFCPGYAGSGD